ncbi:MAG TPA: CYTH domain-containing protein [Pseudogracilibacillus sp.]|nr:CYTH domain-containing protein [Pseudogracilibacillus sp.]
MNQEIEIEYKTLLTKEAFDKLNKVLPFPQTATKQVNYYFETADLKLKEKRSAIRIREKQHSIVLTLKQPHPDGILETHERLTEEEFTAFLQNNISYKEHIGKQLSALGIDMTDLQYFGALTTYRRSFLADGIEYVLDESHYGNKIDFELEIEAGSATSGTKAFQTLLQEHQIEQLASITKIERFFNEMYQS